MIERLIRPSLESMGFRLVRVQFGGGARPTLQIMAEPLDGSAMTVQHCADISRSVSAILDVEDPIPSAYMLEVTSPGIDRPLITRDDFRRFAGFDAKLETTRLIGGRRRFQGVISAVDKNDEITVTDEAGAASVPFDAVLKAKLVITDKLMDASLNNLLPPPAAYHPDPGVAAQAVPDSVS
jgi:ribosome maturation factor RimP